MKTTRFYLISLFLFYIGINLQSQSITGLTLINSASDTEIGSLNDGDEIDLASVGTALNVRANVSGTVGSVKFEYDEANIGSNGNATIAIESVAPYAMRGDQSGDYKNWTPSVGTHTLTVTAYTEASAGGTAGTSYNINFTVVNDGSGGSTGGGTTPGGGTGYDPPSDPGTGAVTQSGELKKWHKTTLSFDGPACGETDNAPNPFLDYRLNITFTNGAKTYKVPGYFATDGNAAESGASSGNVWRVHFTPDEIGVWTWTASFKIGQEVAISLNEADGTAVTPIDGKTGSFTVSESDKTGRDLRSKGRLEYVGEHYLRWSETGDFFIKGGPDAPENMLAYDDFDGNFKSDGISDNRIKSWSAHASDWNTGDPSWQSGKGKEIIGAVNYLASEGLNVFSFLTMNINGDDKNVFPYVSVSDYKHIDCSRMDQWGILFDHAMTKGMYLHFKTQETENELLLDGGSTGVNRKLYYRELVARFGYHLALNWNLGEENSDQTDQQRKDMAQYFYDIDPYHHHVVIHTYPGEQSKIYTPLLGSASKLTGASVQTGWNSVHSSTSTWVINSATAGKKWVVANDEQGSAGIGVPDDTYTGSPSLDDIRKQTLWGNLMAGGAGVEYYFGYTLPQSDLTCEDYRSRDKSWDYVRYAIEFFDNNALPLNQMTQNDDLASNGWCLAKEGQVYLVYLKDGGTSNLTVNTNATYNIKWYDPRNGGALKNGTVTSISGMGLKALGNAPDNTTKDWLVLVTNSGGINLSPTAVAGSNATSGTAPLSVNFNASDSDDPDGTIASYAWNFGDGTTGTGETVSHSFTNAGNYEVVLTVTDNDGAKSTDVLYISVTSLGGGAACGTATEMMSKDFPAGTFYVDNFIGQSILAVTPTPPNAATGSTQMAFAGESCKYNITFHGVDENDGQSAFKLYIDNALVGEYTLPVSTQPWELDPKFNKTFTDVQVNNGSIIKVEGTTATDGAEWSRARWLKVAFNPAGGSTGGGSTVGDCGEALFEEVDGIAVIEVESVTPGSGWSKESSVSGYTGTAYFEWKGGDKFSSPGSGLTEYKVRINTPGTYHFRWHNKIMEGTNTTESNDTWLRIPDADDFFAKNNTSIKYPKGGMFVQSTAVVNGASANGWMKVYCSGTTAWNWSARTSDNDAHEIYATFNSPGVYTVQMSGRSNYHAIDRMVLFMDSKYSVSQATNTALTETPCTGGPVADVYDVTFKVNNGSANLSGAQVSVNGTSATTNASGEAVVKLADGTYTYAVSADGYDAKTGTVTINGADKAETVSLSLTTATVHDVTFIVTDISGPVNGASVSFNGQNKLTDVQGKVVFAGIEAQDAMIYTITKSGYVTKDGALDVNGAESEAVALQAAPPNTFEVQFMVTDGTNPLEGAYIYFNDKEVYTSASGEALFTGLTSSTLDYIIILDGYEIQEGSVAIIQNSTELVTLTPKVVDNVHDLNQLITMYPNPAGDFVTLDGLSEINSIQILTLSGQIISSIDVQDNSIRIDLSDYSSGMYIINLNTPSILFSKKLIVQ